MQTLKKFYFGRQKENFLVYEGELLQNFGSQSMGSTMSRNGLFMYKMIHNGDYVDMYQLSRPYSLINPLYIGRSLNINQAGETSPKGIYLTADGLRMYCGGSTSGNILQYTLSTAWDVRTAVFVKSFNTGGATPVVQLSQDGYYLFTGSVNSFKKHTLSVPFEIDSVISSINFSLPLGNISSNFHITTNGRAIFCNSGSSNIIKHTLTEPYSMVVAKTQIVNISSIFSATNFQGITVSEDGKKLITTDYGYKHIILNMPTPFKLGKGLLMSVITPNVVTGLSVGPIYNTAVQLHFTPPSSARAIVFYECYLDGVFKQEIKNSGEFITGLTPATNYNITLVAVDVFYNKSVVSNVVNVSTNTIDADPYLYIDASGNQAYEAAIVNLFSDLKAQGLYNKIQAFYPFLGTTQAQHKWNAKNPLDTNAAFRLQFFGGGTHSNLGYQCNGTNAYANTFFVPSTNQNVNSNGLSVVVGSNIANIQNDVVEIGSFVSLTQASLIQCRGNNTSYNRSTRINGNTINQINQNDARGVFTSVKQSATFTKFIRNKTEIASGNSGGNLPNISLFVGNLNINGTPYAAGWSTQRIQFTAIHEGLTDAEVVALHTIIDNFEAAIGRKTW
ncbi:fibronectin type III domain-containing protein [Flavobacterium polysaccharolyticum]|uniref:Fibronectin type III domain-containing protein n=1 Tax=Flavobacterium polysaccharolyticum TaxID=3133148 RepID=A0ABU9NIL5_9FLAO